MGLPLVVISAGGLPPSSGRSVLCQTAEMFWKLEPVLQPAKILAFDPEEPDLICRIGRLKYSAFAKK
jgi:hypothetical protein